MTEYAKSSSFSRAELMKKCPLQFKLRHLLKVPDPAPDPEPGTERPLDRGSRIHDEAERYVDGTLSELPPDLKEFEDRFIKLRKLYVAGIVALEEEYGFTKDWTPCAYDDWDNCVYRAKGDVVIRPNDTNIIVIDHKTGKKAGNEVKHHEQLVEYAICSALLNPKLQIFSLQNWYLDQPFAVDNPMKRVMTRRQILAAFPAMKQRHKDVLDRVVFPASPSRFACYFCPYKTGTVGKGKNSYPGTGHCTRNVC